VLEIPSSDQQKLREILKELAADPDVEFAEEDKVVRTNLSANDPYLAS
jgi:hypothetical protein